MNLGACCVSLFFFFSGYGLMTSYRTKGERYLHNFLGHRLTKVLLPLLTAYIVTLPIYALLKGPIDWLNVVKTIDWGGPYLRFSWFVTEIVVLYIVFFIVMRPNYTMNAKRIVLTSGVILLMVILIATRQPNWYIISLPGFIIGVWYQAFEERISNILSNDIILILAIFVWFFTWRWNIIGSEILSAYRWEYLSYYVYNIAFVFMTIGLLQRIKLTPPILYITPSSYEVYLMQNCAMIISSAIAFSFVSYWAITISLSVIIGFLTHRINMRLYKL